MCCCFTSCAFDFEVLPYDLTHQADDCAIYCEEHGYTHGRKLARFYPLVQRRVAFLHAMPGGYKQANLAVYIVLLPLLIVACLSLARHLNLSLYDTYIVVFALIGPTLLNLLVIATGLHLVW